MALIYALSEETAQQWAHQLIERALTAEEVLRLMDMLDATDRIRKIVEEAIQIVTEKRP